MFSKNPKFTKWDQLRSMFQPIWSRLVVSTSDIFLGTLRSVSRVVGGYAPCL